LWQAEFARIQALNQASSGRLCSDSSSGPELISQLAAGDCFVWCTGRAIIVRDALRSAGFEARVVRLVPDGRALPTGVIRLSSEGHATVEYRGPQGWEWIGPTHSVHAGGLSVDAFLVRRDPASLVRYAGAEDLTAALERCLTADKFVVPER
jgi:hypothetical protein